MTQLQNGAPSGAVDLVHGAAGKADESAEPFAGWLALADPDGPIDLQRFFPGLEVWVEPNSVAFSHALSSAQPIMVVLIAPPAGPGDLERVAMWLGAHRDTSAVLLSPHQAVAVRLHALELGFDDAVDLSADPMEVVGRLSIAGRRGPVNGNFPEDRIPVGEGVELDRRARAIRRDGRLAFLRPRELALLEFLAMHPGRAFSREELIRHVWHGVGANERVVDVYVYWLRAKIELDPANPTHLVTVRGSGYLFDPPEDASSSPGATPSNVNEPPTSR
ncbi:MAG TPA: response regulator transcription factor [Candidatus Limnocylindrales bacterium]